MQRGGTRCMLLGDGTPGMVLRSLTNVVGLENRQVEQPSTLAPCAPGCFPFPLIGHRARVKHG